jgi:hypothetical protein
MTDKQKRNKEIIKLHNSGLSSQQIADKVGLSKAGIYKIITDHIKTIPAATVPDITTNKPEPKQTAPALNVTKSIKQIFSFGDLLYTGRPNEYKHKQTNEIIKVKFNPASKHFETV